MLARSSTKAKPCKHVQWGDEKQEGQVSAADGVGAVVECQAVGSQLEQRRWAVVGLWPPYCMRPSTLSPIALMTRRYRQCTLPCVTRRNYRTLCPFLQLCEMHLLEGLGPVKGDTALIYMDASSLLMVRGGGGSFEDQVSGRGAWF